MKIGYLFFINILCFVSFSVSAGNETSLRADCKLVGLYSSATYNKELVSYYVAADDTSVLGDCVFYMAEKYLSSLGIVDVSQYIGSIKTQQYGSESDAANELSRTMHNSGFDVDVRVLTMNENNQVVSIGKPNFVLDELVEGDVEYFQRINGARVK